ncbi:MAG: AsnC family transcriptional regulator, partial [Brevibacterium aurantiacum]|nr:AsnC family transcriptional regulator [Brevibacterium aurantiacum]MDN6371939.1 AsnC family transcriptional regulator [Brevibacterium aurantiacum]
MAFDLDDIDRSIIAALVEDSRLSVRQLAERVHIS